MKSILGLLTVGIGLIPQAILAANLDLKQAVSYALEHNQAILAQESQGLAAEAQRDAAKGGRLPQLGLSYSMKVSNNPLDAFADKLYTGSFDPVAFASASAQQLSEPDSSELHSAELSLRYPIYAGGAISAGIALADAKANAVRWQTEAGRATLVFQVKQLYYSVLMTQRLVEAMESAVTAAAAHAKTTARLVREGRIISSDKLTAQLNQSAMEARLAQAKRQHQAMLNRLKLSLGLEQSASLNLAPIDWTQSSVAEGFERLVSQAMETHPQLHAQQSMLSASEAQVKLSRSARRPRFDFIATANTYAESFGADYESWRVMGVVSMPLFDGGQSHNQVAAARQMKQATQTQLQFVRSQLTQQIRDALDYIDSAKQRQEIARGNVAKAKENVRLVKTRYGQGRTILIDLLQAERALVETRQEALTADFDYRLGFAQLEYSLGQKH